MRYYVVNYNGRSERFKAEQDSVAEFIVFIERLMERSLQSSECEFILRKMSDVESQGRAVVEFEGTPEPLIIEDLPIKAHIRGAIVARFDVNIFDDAEVEYDEDYLNDLAVDNFVDVVNEDRWYALFGDNDLSRVNKSLVDGFKDYEIRFYCDGKTENLTFGYELTVVSGDVPDNTNELICKGIIDRLNILNDDYIFEFEDDYGHIHHPQYKTKLSSTEIVAQ